MYTVVIRSDPQTNSHTAQVRVRCSILHSIKERKRKRGTGTNLVCWVLVAGKGPDEDLGGGGRPNDRARARQV
jgi:hypothetical protein